VKRISPAGDDELWAVLNLDAAGASTDKEIQVVQKQKFSTKLELGSATSDAHSYETGLR
jgi:hypothetical protein